MITHDRVRSALPSKDELQAALRGHYLLGPLCAQAYGLAELHRLRRTAPEEVDDLDVRRDRLIAEIDEWVRATLPARRSAESLGAFIDRMAAVSDHAFDLLMTIAPGSAEMHAAWTRLAEMEIAYGELAAALANGAR